MRNNRIVMVGTVGTSFYDFRADLIKDLIEKDNEVFALTTDDNHHELEKIQSLGATPVPYNLNRGGLNPFSDIKSTLALAKKIRDINPDLVFCYFVKPVIFGTLAAKLARAPKVVGMLEGLGYTFTDQPQGLSKKAKIIKSIQIALYKIALPQLDDLIFLNPDDPQDLLQKHSIKVKSMHILGGIGVNLEDYVYQAPPTYIDAINFLFIGRLLKEKGIHEFIAASKIVKNDYPNAKFTILGAIDEANPGALKKSELDELTSSGIIEYPGHVNNIIDWIANSHVFILPSYREGVPRSTQEAMAIGRPVITTDVPGCRETVIDGVNGFLVEKWNPSALAEKMIFFIRNPDQIEEMGLKSYEIAQDKFDAQKINKRLLRILGL